MYLQGDRIEAYTIVKSLMESYKDYPKEGDIYDIENFRVMDNNDDYKLAAHSFKLNFIPSAVFRESSVNIVLRGFHLIPIKSIIEESE